MHKDIAFVRVHYDEPVVPSIVKEFQPPSVAFALSCLGSRLHWRSVGLRGIVVVDGLLLGRRSGLVELVLIGREGVDGEVLGVVEVAFGFASGVVGGLIVKVIHLYLLWAHGGHVVVLVIAACLEVVLETVAALVDQLGVFSELKLVSQRYSIVLLY